MPHRSCQLGQKVLSSLVGRPASSVLRCLIGISKVSKLLTRICLLYLTRLSFRGMLKAKLSLSGVLPKTMSGVQLDRPCLPHRPWRQWTNRPTKVPSSLRALQTSIVGRKQAKHTKLHLLGNHLLPIDLHLAHSPCTSLLDLAAAILPRYHRLLMLDTSHPFDGAIAARLQE